jgi:hypothetical protein
MIVPRIALGLLALAFLAVFLVSDREWGLTSAPRVEHLDTLPDDPALAPVRRYTEFGSGVLPYTSRERSRRAAAAREGRPPIKVGFAIREVSILRVPLWASDEYGLVTYFERAEGYRIALMSEEQVALLERLSGRSYAGRSFALWRHLWGWLFVLGLIAWYLLHRRAAAKWREETGII